MPTPAPKRRVPRYPCHVPASLRLEGKRETHRAEILDVSAAGARIRCGATIVHVGERVELAVRTDTPFLINAQMAFAEPLEYLLDGEEKAEAHWSEGATGVFGVKFLSISADEHRRLLALLEKAKLSGAIR